MAKNAVVSEELANKFKTEKETPYTRWVKAEGLDIIPSFYVQNLRTVELKPWARRGGNAVFLNHDASRTSNDCYVMEIPPGKSLVPHRQLYEEMIMVLSGRGSTTVWNDAGARITFEWKDGALFVFTLGAERPPCSETNAILFQIQGLIAIARWIHQCIFDNRFNLVGSMLTLHTCSAMMMPTRT